MKSIYINGNIITLEDVTGNALVEEDGKIIEIGNLEDIDYQGIKVIDLKGKTLMPGFIDAHSHISGYASSLLQVSLKECKSIQDILDKIIKHKDQSYIVCSQYDQHMLKEQRHITRQELDDLNIDSMIVIQHQTGHMAIVNTKVLEYLHITKDTKVEGGYIDYDQGLLEENAFTANALKLPMPTLDELLKAYQKAQYIYASYGITTAQDGMIMDELTDIYQKLIDNNVLYLDVVGYPGFQAHQFIEQFKDYQDYKHHFKVGGYKMFLDGSPQNKTAWTIDPYTDGTSGYPTLTDQQIENNLKRAIKENKQVIAHCNGDQAIEHYINIYEKVHQQDIRPVIVHAQMMRENQIIKAKNLNMIASYFVDHVHYFGDIHKENMGIQRAQTISPLHTSLKHHLLFTLHQDSPVLEPHMLETVSIAMNRKTLSNDILGKEECIQAIDALKAITINAAYQYHEEHEKGSLKVGKKADMIILSDNPLTSKSIQDIEVLYTIKDGRIIYKKEKV